MALTPALKLFEKELEIVNAPGLRHFREGLLPDEVRSQFKRIGLEPTSELVELYSWKDGQEWDTPLISFGAGCGMFMPLADAIDEYKGFWKEEYPDYFPFVHDEEYLVNLNKSSPGYGRVSIYCPGLQIMEPQEAYRSLETMFATFTACFRNKIYYYDENGKFEEDLKKSVRLSAEMSPGMLYWEAFIRKGQ